MVAVAAVAVSGLMEAGLNSPISSYHMRVFVDPVHRGKLADGEKVIFLVHNFPSEIFVF